MPELPETETIARDLEELIAGGSIAAVTVRRPDVLRGATATGIKKHLVGQTVDRVFRRAKTVVLQLSGDRYVLVTPRFTGSIQVAEPDEYATVVMGLADGRTVVYRDVRRLGTVQVADREGYARFDARLGIEPLSPLFTAEALSGILRSSSVAIKKTLMDQRRVAGVGNIYANEVLWLSGVDPSRESRRVPAERVVAIRDSLVELLQAAIAARGTTFRDYRDARNERGGFASSLRAYGRGGLPCSRCGTRLAETWAIDGRSTVFCHRCQG